MRAAAGALFAPATIVWQGRKAAARFARHASRLLTGFGATGNVYDELGVTTVINGEGTMTVLGGSLMRPEVEAVMTMAGRHFVPILELEVAAGKRIAQLLKLPGWLRRDRNLGRGGGDAIGARGNPHRQQ